MLDASTVTWVSVTAEHFNYIYPCS